MSSALHLVVAISSPKKTPASCRGGGSTARRSCSGARRQVCGPSRVCGAHRRLRTYWSAKAGGQPCCRAACHKVETVPVHVHCFQGVLCSGG